MKLLIDLGNTRLKWALWNGIDLQFSAAAAHAEFADSTWADLPTVDAIWVASVASTERNDRLVQAGRQRLGLEPRFVRSRAQACGVRNAYAQPERLGVDRFLALIAAHVNARAATVIASCGTALTLDAVAADGTHLGGLIAASPDLALAALRGGTANLAAAAAGTIVEIADNTADAMESGSWLAAAALVERFMASAAVRLQTDPQLIVTGGGAQRLAGMLSTPLRIEPDLVLRGLAHLADAGG